MTVRVEHRTDGATSIHVAGSIDQRTAPLLERYLINATHTCQVVPPHVTLDLTQVVHLDQTGMDTILDTQLVLQNASGEMDLLDPPASVVRLLHETIFDGESSTV